LNPHDGSWKVPGVNLNRNRQGFRANHFDRSALLSIATWALLCAVLFVGPGSDRIDSPVGTGEQGDTGDGGPASQASLNQPFDLVFDPKGNLFFSDTGNHKIRRVDAESGIIATVAGSGKKGYSGDGGPATEASLDEPYGLALDAKGNLYFADRLNRRVRWVEASSGRIDTLAGNGKAEFSGDGGPANLAGLVEPNDVDLDASAKRLYIADVAGHRVREVDLESKLISTFAGTGRAAHQDARTAKETSLHGPRALRVTGDGEMWIVERDGNRLCRLSSVRPVVVVFAGTGEKCYTGDDGSAFTATLNGPKELALAPDGAILIVDTENQVIRRVDGKTWLISTIAGNGRAGGSGDGGPALSAELNRPHGVAVAPDGSIWIGDTNNHRIRRVQSNQP
jgi:sugar lactone lactonase YvrE